MSGGDFSKAIKTYKNITNDISTVGRDLPFEGDDFKYSILVDYTSEVSRMLTRLNSKIESGVDINISYIYPNKVGRLLEERSMRRFKDWTNRIIYHLTNGPIDNEFKFILGVFYIWHITVKELLFPIMIMALQHPDSMEKISYEVLGFRKEDLKPLEVLLDIQKKDVDRFIQEKNVTDQELKELYKYLRRLVSYQVYMKYL